ncbi:hypothetical protein CDL12_28773 [Handroanthus impetiginosus]|uniref:Uncharacterized protein n=1 Tax=Handroanthus impetiginosus TaxID=429701 RepID=A0A2G9G1G5_9LAMI|nr:hypothetical protein CDL12_28773 [Handroanthus impetiginosus]
MSKTKPLKLASSSISKSGSSSKISSKMPPPESFRAGDDVEACTTKAPKKRSLRLRSSGE